MSSISVRYGDASVDLAAAVDMSHISGARMVSYNVRDLLGAAEQVLRAVGTAEAHELANRVYELTDTKVPQ